MKLLVDAGNTRIKWAVVADADRSMAPLPRWQQQGAVERAQVERLARDWGALARQAAPEEELQICVSNVAGPALRDSLQAILHGVFGPRVIVEWFASTAERAGVRNGYRHPGQLGCDRFAAAIGARALFPDQELLVATCGTATTIDVVNGSSTVTINGGPAVDEFATYIRNTDPGSNAGNPGLALPAGMTRSGLPVGIELDGPLGSDRRLLAIAMAFETVLGRLPAPPA